MSASQQYCTFLLGDALFGVAVAQVQEVIRFQEMTRVPLALPLIEGLINLRGQIVTAIDLRRRMRLAARAPEQLPMNVVVRNGESPVSLLVDEIGDVIEVDDQLLEDPPNTLQGFDHEVVRGVYKLPGRLLLVLDVDRIVDLEDLRKPDSEPDSDLNQFAAAPECGPAEGVWK